MIKKLIFPLSFLCILSCNQQPASGESKLSQKDAVEQPLVTLPADNVPLLRDVVQQEPVAQHSEKTENPLNDWYFSVKLFETPKTFHYLIKLQYEEIRGTDTLKLPNFGILPKPVIQKGPEKYSCIIGFMDKDNQFREYKKVYVKDDVLKITALKHYAVSFH